MSPFWIRSIGAAFMGGAMLAVGLSAGMPFPNAWLVTAAMLLGVAIHQAGAER